ncbi:hypothetical protein Tco_0151704 [Tanacetum coccineum]
MASPEKTVSGKDFSNLLIVDSLLKTIWFINAPCFCNEALAIPGQTATSKELSNPLMAGTDIAKITRKRSKPGKNEHETEKSAQKPGVSRNWSTKCGVNFLLGTCLNCTYGDGKPVTCCGCEGPLRGGFCSFYALRDGNSFDYNPNPNSYNEYQKFSDYPPQPRYETNFCELCGNDAHFGYDCPTQVPFNSNPDPCYNQNFDNNFPLTSPSFLQQYLCCENCGGPHATFQYQPMNQDFYNSKFSSFDQFQPPQFPVNYPPQETSKEILQAREDLMEAIQAFLKEYDHIPPNGKCMALLLAEERFLKIKQTMEEEQNQPEVIQELLLKLMNDLQILKGIQQEKKETAAQSFTPYWNFSMIDDEEARENFMKDICTFLRKFSRIPFGVTPKVILIAWERFGEIKHALTDKQYRQEDIQELMSKLLEDVRNISEELSEYINCPSWNRPTIFFDDDDEYTIIYSKPKAITPDLPIEEPDNSLSMGDEHLSTIPETESDELIKSSVEDLVPIPSELEGISDDTCDMPVGEDSSTFDALSDHSEILSDSNNDGTSSDDNDFEDIEYVDASPPDSELVSLEEVNDVDQEEKEFDLEDILQIQDVILREKLLNISRLITNIESLNDNPTPNRVLKSPSSVPISVTDSNSFFEKSDTSFSFSDNSLPEFETFSDHTEETRSGRLISIVISDNSNDPLLELPEFESFHFDPSFPRPPPEPPDVEISLIIETDAPVINNFDELNEDECFDPGGGEIDVSQNVEDDDSFTFVIRTFLPFLTYPVDSPLLLSTGSEDTIFDPGIST